MKTKFGLRGAAVWSAHAVSRRRTRERRFMRSSGLGKVSCDTRGQSWQTVWRILMNPKRTSVSCHSERGEESSWIPAPLIRCATPAGFFATLRMTRVWFVSLVYGLTAVIAAPAPASRPNIVLIVADDHGTDAIGCYGNKDIQTPTLHPL